MTQEKGQQAKQAIQRIQSAADEIRYLVLAHTIKNNGGYLSQACSAAEILATLYLDVLQLETLEKPLMPGSFRGVPGKENPNHARGDVFHGRKSRELDRFILSPTHYSLVLYAALIASGRMDKEGLREFNKDGGVVEMIGADHSPGMEMMTGSLGQGMSQAAGIAFGRKLRDELGRVVVLLSDGECQCGQFWEAVQVMTHHTLDNMLAYVDMNGYQCDGKTETVLNIERLDKRLEAFGARVFRVDGHDIGVLSALGKMKPDGRPTFILCDTDPCKRIPLLKERVPKLHYLRFTSEKEKSAYQAFFNELQRSDGLWKS